MTAPPSQVEIESKFLEVTQNNLKEMGIDWLLGQFAMPFGSGVLAGAAHKACTSGKPSEHQCQFISVPQSGFDNRSDRGKQRHFGSDHRRKSFGDDCDIGECRR